MLAELLDLELRQDGAVGASAAFGSPELESAAGGVAVYRLPFELTWAAG